MKNIILTALLLLISLPAFAQEFSKIQRNSAKDMLRTIKSELEKKYYDPKFRGIDLEQIFNAAETEIERANSFDQAMGIIAQAVLDLEDSHTIFLPPSRASKIEYGWRMKMIGDKCYVVAVKPKSDAEGLGLKPGDEILSVNGFRPNRLDISRMRYFYYSVKPHAEMQLIVKSPNANEPRKLTIKAKIKQLKQFVDLTTMADIYDLIREAENENELREHRFVKVNDVVIWKMPSFLFPPEDVDSLVRSKTDSSKSSLVFDLRGNSGGYVETLERLIEYLFDKDIKIADQKGRKEIKPLKAQTKGSDALKGKVIVLIDHDSSSAAEVLARVIQLEKRGVVIGDRSAGAVTRARSLVEKVGVDRVIFYGLSYTDAQVLMSDGKNLENVGVVPDELLLPTGADLAAGKDPVLARAIEIAGAKVTPEQAGKFFPVKWEK